MLLKIFYFVILSKVPGIFTTEDGFPENSEELDKIEEVDITEPCPSNMSSFSANDLKVIIDELVEKFEIYEKLNTSYYVNATATRDSIKQKIDGFTSWIVDKPKHLKHILEEIASQHQLAEDKMSTLEDIERQYNASSQTYFILLDELAKQQHICQLNCFDSVDDYCSSVEEDYYYWDDEKLLSRAAINGSDSKYCSSYKSVRDLVNSKLQSFLNETYNFVEEKLQIDERTYINKVNDYEQKMKMVALKEFGQVMFDILDIKDQYFHLHEKLKDVLINHIIVQLTNIEKNLKELEYKIEEYANDCRHCILSSNGLQLISRDATQEESDSTETDKVDEDKSKNILESLLENKMRDIKRKINNDFISIFDDINEILDGDHMNDSLTDLQSNLQDLWSEINDITQKEISNIEQLETRVPKTISNLENLSQDLNLLANDVVKSLTDIIHTNIINAKVWM